jgi:hypothetical protein
MTPGDLAWELQQLRFNTRRRDSLLPLRVDREARDYILELLQNRRRGSPSGRRGEEQF